MSLKILLADNHITQSALRAVLLQPNGKPLSAAAMSQLINYGIFPRLMEREKIEEKTKQYLMLRGVSADSISAVWDSNSQTATAPQPEPKKEIEMRKEILSQEAQKRFELARNPFVDDIHGRGDVYRSGNTAYVQEVMYQAAVHGGFIAIVGESGSGKSTLRRDLQERFLSENARMIFIQPRCIDKGRITAPAICDAIIFDVGEDTITSPSRYEHKSRKAEHVLINSLKAGYQHCLVMDEAHDLHALTMKALKRFNELEYGFKRLLSVIMIGQTELKAKLSERNEEIREVARRCEIIELQPLGKDLEAYLAKKFAGVGVRVESVFDSDAYDAIRALLHNNLCTDTYPLVVNNLVIACLNRAAEISEEKILINEELVLTFANADAPKKRGKK